MQGVSEPARERRVLGFDIRTMPRCERDAAKVELGLRANMTSVRGGLGDGTARPLK
jgi:hypothetical protein